jgi:glyoxylase-like metal-dependent hydrolase (beta-lactamase superfamily II)
LGALRIKRWTGPPAETHSYLAADLESGEAWVVDAPLQTADLVLECCRKHDLRISLVVLTHAHFDHLLDMERYVEAGIPVAGHSGGIPLLGLPQTALFGVPNPMPTFSIGRLLREGQQLRLGPFAWEVWHVPGHAPGHILLYCKESGVAFGGDLIFRQGYGRVDLPHADPVEMAQSLARLLDLPDETRILAGHGEEVVLGEEREWLEPLLVSPEGFGL